MENYKHVGIFLAEDLKYKYPEFYKKEVGEHSDNYFWVLCKLDCEGNPYEQLGYDGGEPEDQILVRDWSWVAKMADDYLDCIYELEKEKESKRSLEEFFSAIVDELKEQNHSYSYRDPDFIGFTINHSDKYSGRNHATITIYCEDHYSSGETGNSEIVFPYEWFNLNKTAKEIATLILQEEDNKRKKQELARKDALLKAEERDKAEYMRLKNKYGE